VRPRATAALRALSTKQPQDPFDAFDKEFDSLLALQRRRMLETFGRPFSIFRDPFFEDVLRHFDDEHRRMNRIFGRPRWALGQREEKPAVEGGDAKGAPLKTGGDKPAAESKQAEPATQTDAEASAKPTNQSFTSSWSYARTTKDGKTFVTKKYQDSTGKVTEETIRQLHGSADKGSPGATRIERVVKHADGEAERTLNFSGVDGEDSFTKLWGSPASEQSKPTIESGSQQQQQAELKK
jgi:hypothetical protein